jgi:hypothetical protein
MAFNDMGGMRAIAASILACAFPAQAEPWTETQQALAATYLTVHAIDWAQTRNLARKPEYEEKNPILGKKPSGGKSGAYFLLTPVVGYFILDALPKYRTELLAVANVIEIGVVAHNFSIGIKAKF